MDKQNTKGSLGGPVWELEVLAHPRKLGIIIDDDNNSNNNKEWH
jgi:hypothetical protein